MKRLLLAVSISMTATPVMADEPIVVHLKNHKFSPAVIKVKANKPAMIILYNDDDSADEFDSSSLKIERVVPGHNKGNIRLRALSPGKYPFMGEFHAATAQGMVIAE
ncbi:MAG TPA: cupredoxin domain-containing protein [Rhizomicrobium sp.]|nr:cupredoxin domain-containing protein [Rhizomicrobium sp.]